jgi:hypothetical protein
MRLSVSPATPFSDGSLPNHTKMFELVHMVTSMDDFEATQGRDIIRPIAPSSSMGAPQSSCRKIRTGAEDLVGRRVPRCALDNLGVQKVLAPSKYPLKWPIKFCPQTKNNLPHFQNQRYIIIAKQQKHKSVLHNTKEIFEYYVTTKACKKAVRNVKNCPPCPKREFRLRAPHANVEKTPLLMGSR